MATAFKTGRSAQTAPMLHGPHGMEQAILNVVLLVIVAIIFWVASRSLV